jgi:hypothetical protein
MGEISFVLGFDVEVVDGDAVGLFNVFMPMTSQLIAVRAILER